jgi:ribonucleotide reductase alpha subunit
MSKENILNDDEMYVTKRNGKQEIVSFDKILTRIKKIGKEANIKLNYTSLVMKVIDQLYSGISTTKIDELSAEQCASMSSIHPDYNILAGRITVSNHHKNTDSSFTTVMRKLYEYRDNHNKHCPLITHDFFNIVSTNSDEFDSMCDYERDYFIEYFGCKTLERAYLMQVDKVIVERPQHMWLRVAIGIHGDDIVRIRETYDLMSHKLFTHATPTLFNAGTPHPQLSSCFLLAMENDSISGIYNTLRDCAMISKWAGGIGLHIHNIRASGSHIRGTNGSSNGIVPMLKVFNNTAKYVDQCLDPETIVYTKQGAKPIKNIVIGDKVVADDGNYYKIGKILDNEYYGDLYILDVKHTLTPIKLTDMHPLWVIQNNIYYQRSFNDIINQLDRNLLVPEFIEVKKIDKNDFIGFPIPKYEKDIGQYTEDDCRFYGIMLGDGNISSVNNLAYVALNKDTKKDTIDFVENYLTKMNIHITYTYVHDKYVRLTWTRTNMFKFTYEMLYDANKEKYVIPNMLHLPKPKILNIIKGVLETDGKVKDYQIVLEITSLSIVESIRYMLLRLGILTSGSVRDRRNESHITKYNSLIRNTKISYILIVPKKQIICDLFKHKNLTTSGSFTFFEYKGYLFSIVNSNKCIRNYSGRVIDIEVDNDYHHNFLTHSGLVKNGGGKRNGSFAIYLEPWHADIEHFLQMRKNHGDEEMKARDLFYALWIPDLFMERVKADGNWTLMCPDECPGLADVHNKDFVTLYESYEQAGRGKKTMKARNLWFQVLDAQMETGTPYLCYKDSANRKSNQQNLGTIKSSNLCVAPETVILTDTGPVEIQTLKDQDVNVWNGQEFSKVTVYQTGTNQELISVETDDGAILRCTPYHRFFVHSEDGLYIDLREAKELKQGDKLMECNFPFVPACMTEFTYFYEKALVSFANDTIQIYSHTIEDLHRQKCVLQGCGINVPIFRTKGSIKKSYIEISIENIHILKKNGFSPNNNNFLINTPTEIQDNPQPTFVKIKHVVNFLRTDDTYCFTEPKRNAGIFNGMLTSQCSEIIEYSNEEESAVCNLASIALPAFVKSNDDGIMSFDYNKLHTVAKVVTYNLNRVIDVNYYPTEKTKRSNMRHRPIGIGVQGLADVFMQMGLPFSADKSKLINRDIFETIYHAALEQSCEIAEERYLLLEPLAMYDDFSDRLSVYEDVELRRHINSYEEQLLHTSYRGAYSSFKGSPASRGELQFDLWGVEPSDRYDWTALKSRIRERGIRNSLLLAPMPTASTSQILGYNECIEPITSNIYNRRTIAGEFILANKYLMQDLLKLDLWNEKMKNNIIANNGSIQHLEQIPVEIREKYRTVWEIPMRQLIDMAADRGAFVCQSQSLNLWLEDPNYSNLTSMHFYSWSKGLKTGIYYLRRRARHQAQQFTIEPEKKDLGGKMEEGIEDEICEMCSA